MIKHFANLPFKIVEYVFVLYAQDLAGKHLIPMLHKADIVAVITTDLRKPVSEFLPFGEKLLEAGKAAIHRISTRIDDPGIGQDKVDQPDMAKIVGHFIDEERRIPAMNTRGFNEIAAKLR